MAAPTVRASTAVAGAAGTTAVFTAPTGLADGDIVVVCLYKENTNAITTPAGWATWITVAATGFNHYAMWKRASGEGASFTFSWTGSVWRNGACLAIQSAVASGDPSDTGAGVPTGTHATSGGGAAARTCPDVSLTTQGVDRLLLYSGCNILGGTWTAPSGFDAEVYDGGDDLTVDRKAQAAAGATGAQHATCFQSNVGETSSILLALLPVGTAVPFILQPDPLWPHRAM